MAAADEFVAGLIAYGAAPTASDGFVVYTVEAVEGRFAGQPVESAVGIDELQRWPLVPPHWLYFHSAVTFAATNTQPCPLAGWLGHVRGVIGEAT